MGKARDIANVLTTIQNIDVTEQLNSLVVVGSASPSIDTKIWIDTTTASAPLIRNYSNNLWRSVRLGNVAGYFTATGGTVTTSGNYRIHSFSSTSTFIVSESLDTTPNSFNGQVEYLIVAGGGGTGYDVGGGGGAGGLILGSSNIQSAGQYTVQVGGGGVSAAVGNNGADGTNSSFLNNVSIGGGGGGTYNVGTNGRSGGSGGGAALNNSGGAGTSGQGFAGGSAGGSYGSGGGGGAGGLGSTGTPNNNVTGGPSVSSSITGSTINYSGGGYGSPDGGNTYATGNNLSNQTLGYYGFGANGTGIINQSPYNGNAGVVIIRYLT